MIFNQDFESLPRVPARCARVARTEELIPPPFLFQICLAHGNRAVFASAMFSCEGCRQIEKLPEYDTAEADDDNKLCRFALIDQRSKKESRRVFLIITPEQQAGGFRLRW